MKLELFKILLFMIPIGVFGQSFIGLNTDNFNGVHGVLSNPANVVDSRTKIDINLFSLSYYLSNDYASVDLGSGDDTNFDNDENLDPSDDNNIALNLDILGPSFMFNINLKNAIALTTRARSFSNINNVPGNTIKLFDSGIDENTPIQINNISLTSTAHVWSEFGATYGHVFLDKGNHFLKAGITAKYLSGYGYISAESQNLSLDYDPSSLNRRLTANGNSKYSFSRNLDLDGDNEVFDNKDDYEIRSESTGLGFDLGVIYEFRKDEKNRGLKHKNKYFLKAGFSLTDLGSLKYKDAPIIQYGLNKIELSQATLDNGDFKDIESRLNAQESRGSKKIKLPAAMHLNVDWNALEKLYVNLNTDLSLIDQDASDANRIENSVTLTPRLETQFFSLYSPIGFRQLSGFNWGAGFRFGPLYAGSGSIISNLVSDKSKSIDIYAGLKIPIYYSKGRTKKDKDTDNDGVMDKEDNCPDVAGTLSNNGCPEEKVVEEVIEEEVVIVDTDGDSIEDSLDQCPNEFGVAENNGCPVVLDTDGDSVPNLMDRCPEVFGVKENGGCPIIKSLVANSVKAKEVEKTLESYAKVINFSSGKTSFTPETFMALEAIQKILEEYPKAKFDINGYTDSVGAEKSNQLLSEGRATAVKVFFVEKGVTASRLNVNGFGEANPITTNATPLGRKTNRRVEIKIAK